MSRRHTYETLMTVKLIYNAFWKKWNRVSSRIRHLVGWHHRMTLNMFGLGKLEAMIEESEDIYLEYIGSVSSVFGWPLSCVTRWTLAKRCWYPSNLSYSSSFSEKQAARGDRKIHLCPIHAADKSNGCTAQSIPSIRWIWAITLCHWFNEWTNRASLIQKKLLEGSSAAFFGES